MCIAVSVVIAESLLDNKAKLKLVVVSVLKGRLQATLTSTALIVLKTVDAPSCNCRSEGEAV